MKKQLMTLVAVIFCAASFAQGNQQLQDMFDRLQAKGIDYERIQFSNEQGVTVFTMVNASEDYPSINYEMFLEYAMPISNGKKLTSEELSEARTLVRNTLDNLAQTSDECYRFESHKNGCDSVKYSLSLEAGDEPTEAVTYQSVATNGQQPWESILHSVKIYETKADKSFDADEYEALVRTVFDRKDVKIHNINWKQDEGETTGTVFTIANEDKQLAESILENLSRQTYEFVRLRPDQNYTYKSTARFIDELFVSVLCAHYSANADIRENSISVFTRKDDKGFHFLLLRTKGRLSLPEQFSIE